MGYKETYNRWLTSDVVDDDTKAELKSIENNEKEIEERLNHQKVSKLHVQLQHKFLQQLQATNTVDNQLI